MTANTPPNRKPLTDSQRRWPNHIKAAEALGLTQKAYAQREGLSLASLSHHKTVVVHLYFIRNRVRSHKAVLCRHVPLVAMVQSAHARQCHNLCLT